MKGLTLPFAGVDSVWRTESVLAMMTDSGPAAATRPLLEAMESNEAVGGGRESEGHDEGSNRSLASPANV